MSKDPFSKLQSSLPLEDLLAQQDNRNAQKWLLTYLDVFILVVMLVITMISVGDINIQQRRSAAANTTKAPKPKTVICPQVAAPVIMNCPPPVIVENKSEPPATLPENKTGIIADSAKIEAKESNSIAPVQIPEIKIAAETATNPTSPSTNSQKTSTNSADENKLQQQLSKTIDEFGLNKAVNIKVTQGYAQLEIQDKVLFKSSDANLTASGEAVIKRLIPLLKQAVGLILIEGHTDNIPIKSAQFPSNWELGASRATSVLHYLVSQQLDSNHLRAITYADTMPIADNSTPAGREKNRRVNILIKFSEH